MEKNFISTNDSETYHRLLSLGFQEIKNSNGIHTFLNKPFTFDSDDVDKSKISYGNNLCV
jgi:hypothetical protein